jgi:alpha-L-fucosidase
MKLTLAFALIAVGHLSPARAADLERPKSVNDSLHAPDGQNLTRNRVQKAVAEQPLQGPAGCPNPPDCHFAKTTHPEAQWFADAGLGLFVHWGIASVDGSKDLSWSMVADTPWHNGSAKLTPEKYLQLAERFNPSKYDPDQWTRAARAAGFRYVVLTSRHHDGFALWPSAYGDFNTKNYLGGRDLLKPYVEACHKHGLRVGFYYSGPDWHFNREHFSFRFRNKREPASLPDLDWRHQPVSLPEPSDFERKFFFDETFSMTQGASEEHLRRYEAYIAEQVEELLTRYGKIDLLWFDGGPPALPLERIRQLQPAIVINDRFYYGAGDFHTPEVQAPQQRPEGWWEQCAQWNRAWGYTADEQYRPLGAVLAEFVKTRAWGGNYLINVGPRPSGELPELACQRFRELAAWMKHSGESVFGTQPGDWPAKCNVPSTRKAGLLYLHALPEFQEEIVVQEVSRPKQVRLLRTGAKLSYTFENGTLRVQVPTPLRTDAVDTVAVTLSQR